MAEARPIRVLFAIPELDRGGPDRVIFEVLCALDRRRFTSSLLVSSPDGHYLSRLPSDISLKVLGATSTFRDRYPVGRSLGFVRQTAPDVVLATQRMTFTLGIAAPAFPRTTRLILRQANDVSADFATLVQKSVLRHRVARQLALATLRRADAVICQSLAMQSDLRRLLGASAKLRVISNPIDVERITREAASLDVTLPGNPRLISVGRFMPQKGYDILLRAIAVARKRYPGLHLTILGDGPDRGALVQLARELELEQTVTFAGYSDHPVSSVRAADLFVLASRYEGFPNAALEALAVGTPVVLTDCPGASSEIVVPGLNGQLASAVDPESVARAIERAIHELPSCDRRRIVADCDARFGTRRIVSTYEDVIASVAD